MRPILRPGTHVLRRADHSLQLGLDPHQAVVLPGGPEVRTALGLLATAADATDHPASGPVELLETHHLLLDGDSLLPLIPCHAEPERHRRSSQPPQRLHRGDVAALARTAGDRVGVLLEARRKAFVRIVSSGSHRSATLADQLAEMVTSAGMRAARRTDGAEGNDGAGPGLVAVLVRVGEPHREQVDEWVRTSTPHLVVRFSEGTATVGPFVVPGRTACLRCLDAHHTDADRSWPLLVEQYAALSSQDRADGVPEPVDGLLARLALAWAARDLASHAEGRRPSTWSATTRFDAHLAAVETQSWLRHPACGCAWE